MSDRDPKYSVGTLTYTKAGLFMLFGWLLWGDFCFTLFESIGGPGILGLYLQDNFHVSNVQVNIIFSVIPNLIGVIVGPILSFKSDRYRGRMGRRIPYILWTTPFLCFFAAAIGYSDEIVSFAKAHVATGGLISPFTTAMLLISFLVIGFSFFNEFVNTVYWYLFADVVPEHFMGRFMGLFRVVGAVAGFLINVLIAAHQLTHMRMIHVGVAALYFVGFSLMCWRVKEGEYPPVTDVTEKSTFLDQVKLYARECFTHRMFILIYLSTFVWVFARSGGGSGVFGLHLGQHVASSEAHAGAATAAMTPDGARVLSGGVDGSVRLWEGRPEKIAAPFWDAVRRAKLPALRTLRTTGPAVTATALSADGSLAAAGDRAGGLFLWRAADGTLVTNLATQGSAVLTVAESPDGDRLASGSADGTVRIWDVASGRCLETLTGHAGEVRCVVFSSDSRYLVSGGVDGQLRVYDAASGILARTIATSNPVYAATFAPSLEKVAAVHKQGPTSIPFLNTAIRYLTEVFSNESLYDIPANERSRVVAADGWIVTGGQDDGGDDRNAKLRIWSAATGERVMELKGHKQAITSVQYKPDLHLLVSGSLDSSGRLWDPVDVSPLAGDQSLKTFSGYMSGVAALAVTDHGNRIVCASDTGRLHLWNIDAGVSLLKGGLMASFFGVLGLLLAYPFGALVDRYGALRVTMVCSIVLIPAPFLTYFFMRDYQSSVWIEVFKTPFFGLVGAASMPFLISLFPKDKFGQMCSANGLVKQGSAVVLGLVGAMFMDWVTRSTLLTDNFRYANIVTAVGFIGYAAVLLAIYREWLKLGGDKGYKAPESNNHNPETPS